MNHRRIDDYNVKPVEHVVSLEYLMCFIVLHCVLAAFCQLLLNEYCIVLYVVVSELLCFVQQKCNILPVDDLVKIASDFYTTEEAEDARHTLSSLVQERRLPKQKGSAKDVCARTINGSFSRKIEYCVTHQL